MEDTRKLLLRFRRGVKGLILRRFVKLVWRSRPPFRRVDYMMKYEPPESCISLFHRRPETLKVTAGPAEEEWLRRIRSESSPWTLHGGAEKSGESKHYKSMEEWPTLQEAMQQYDFQNHGFHCTSQTFPGVSIDDIITINIGTVNIRIPRA